MGSVWEELVIDAPAETAEIVAAYLALRGGGVEQRDEETLLRASGGRVQVVVHVEPEQAEARMAELGRFRDLRIARRQRDEDEWRDVWKQFFKPLRVGCFVVKPTWEPFTPFPGDRVIELDPGRAFGTGGHESTRLVLAALPSLPSPDRFLDIGTGSGILSIGTALLWPSSTGIAIDIDPDAVACAAENLALARLEPRVAAWSLELHEIESTFDLILANLTAETLDELCAPLCMRLAPGGYCVLSGILDQDASGIQALYEARGLSTLEIAGEGEWRALVLKHPG